PAHRRLEGWSASPGPAQRTMAFHLRQGESVASEIRHIARDQLDAAIQELDDRHLDGDETVHQVRRRCKKLRALLRLIRPHLADRYDVENAHFREAAGLLAPFRDAHIRLVAYDALMDHYDGEIRRRTFASIRRGLVHRGQAYGPGETELADRFAQI